MAARARMKLLDYCQSGCVNRVSNKQTMRVLSGQCMAKFKDTNLAHT